MNTPYDLIGKFLSGEASESEINQLMEWRKQDEKNEGEYLLIVAGWGHSFNEEGKYELQKDQAFEQLEMMINSSQKANPFITYFISGIAAIVVLGIGLTFLINYFQQEKSELISFESESEKKEVVLPDGSTVLLNKNSVLSYYDDFNQNDRSVDLKGEAFFEITKNPDKPFVIEAGKSRTTVLGTAFNLKVSANEHVTITVTEGKVKFSDLNESEKEFLTVGEQAELKPATSMITKEKVKGSNALAWKTGLIVFADEKMENALQVLSEYYDVQFSCEESLKDYSITVTIDRKSLGDMVEVVKNITGFNIAIEDKRYHITR
ncbi:MAG: FecR domain-containing protein [Bacteroidota bacterium]